MSTNQDQIETATADPLNEWFRRIGTTLTDEDYEAGIHAMAAHDAEVAAKALEDAVGHLLATGGPQDRDCARWLRARAAGIRGTK